MTGIIDVERALWGDPLMEYQFRRAAPSPAFATAYGRGMSAALESRDGRRARHAYDAYLDLVMTIEGAYRNYESTELEKEAFERLGEELTALERTIR